MSAVLSTENYTAAVFLQGVRNGVNQDSMNRRELVSYLGAALASGATRRLDAIAPADKLSTIGLQLYTVRSILAQDFQSTLAQVAAIGYREVEFAGYFNRSPADVRAALRSAGLTAPGAHISIQTLRQSWPQTLEAAATIGHRWLIVPSLPGEDRRTLDALKAVADLFNRAGASAREAGLRFGYHNHDAEFLALEGKVPFDVLLEETDPALVEFEMDLFWITRGGGDPLAYFQRFPGRFVMVHVKDMDAQGRMVDVGQGAIDFKRIFAARRKAGIRHFFVEHDNPPSPLDSVRTSYQYLRNLEF
jgi:sugar phosphate isomerase/epimerase